jgi:hypothetical protein
MGPRLQAFVIFISVVILVGIIELVRRRKLREEYSFLWLVIGFGFLLLAVAPGIVVRISLLLGTELPVNTLFFFGLIFVLLLCLYFSLRISSLANQVKNLAQQLSLIQLEKADHREGS